MTIVYLRYVRADENNGFCSQALSTGYMSNGFVYVDKPMCPRETRQVSDSTT